MTINRSSPCSEGIYILAGNIAGVDVVLNAKILNGNSSEDTEIKKIINKSCPYQNFRIIPYLPKLFLFTDINPSSVFSLDKLSDTLRD